MGNPKFCTACGTPVTPGAKFCGECGAILARPSEQPLDEGQTAIFNQAAAIDQKSDAGQTAAFDQAAAVDQTTAFNQTDAFGQTVEPPGSAASGSVHAAPAMQAASPLAYQDRPKAKKRLVLWASLLVALAACLLAAVLFYRPIQRAISISPGFGGDRGELLSQPPLPFDGAVTANDLARQAAPAQAGQPASAETGASQAVTGQAIDQPAGRQQAQAAAPTAAASKPPTPTPAPVAIPPGWLPAACTPSAIRFWIPPDYTAKLYEDTFQLFIIRKDRQASLEIYCGPAEHSTELSGELEWWLGFQNGVTWEAPSYADSAIGPLAWAVGPNSKGVPIFTAVQGPNLNRHVVQTWGMAPEGEWDQAVALFLKILQSGEYTD